MDRIIEIEKLKKYFGGVKAVDDISFSVGKGSLFAFLGINGAGKSTTINILSTLCGKDSGKVIINGLDLDKSPFEIKKQIGIVFQNTVLDDKLTVKDNLFTRASYYGIIGRECEARIKELTDILDLSQILNRPFGKLSGGQRRKVDIARGLIHKPEILFLDEPTTGLDPSTRKQIWSVIKGLQNENNMTVFLTTHYMEEADSANEVVIIDKGKVIASGTPESLKNQYSGNYIKLYGIPDMKLIAAMEKMNIPFELAGDVITVRTKDSKEAFEFLMSHKVYVDNFEVIKGNMDDVFLNATGKELEG